MVPPAHLQVNLRNCSRVTDAGIRMLAESCGALQALDLTACHFISDNSLVWLATGCRELRCLNVSKAEAHLGACSSTDLRRTFIHHMPTSAKKAAARTFSSNASDMHPYESTPLTLLYPDIAFHTGELVQPGLE